MRLKQQLLLLQIHFNCIHILISYMSSSKFWLLVFVGLELRDDNSSTLSYKRKQSNLKFMNYNFK